MKCKGYRDLVMRHFDHALHEEERELLDQHIGSCPHCRALLGDLQGIMQTLETAPQIEPSADMEKLVMNKIHSLPATPVDGTDGFIKALHGSMSIAALLLVCAAALSLPEGGILDLISQGVRGLYSLIEMMWSVQIVYDMLSGLFSQMIALIIKTIYGVFILAGLAAAFMVIKKLLRPELAMQRTKD